jgi:hypothetical protein
MERLKRQANRYQFDELIETNQVKEFPHLSLMAVLKKEGVKVEVFWRKRIKRKVKGEEKEYLREYRTVNLYPRGVLLYSHWEDVSPEEAEDYQELSEEELKRRRIFRKNGKFSILRVMRIEDLPKGIRQRKRHIVRSLIGMRGKGFELLGDAKILARYADRIGDIIKPLLGIKPPSSEFMSRASQEFLQDWQMLERRRTWLIRQAREEILLARQGKFWEMAAHGGKALSVLLEERARKYEMAVSSWLLGEKWQVLYEETRQKFRDAYQRLGRLTMRLAEQVEQWKRGGAKPSMRISEEMHGIYLYLVNAEGSYFDPFCERIQSDEFQALGKVLTWANEDKWERIVRSANQAHAKIEAIAKEEIPTAVETQRGKEMLSL